MLIELKHVVLKLFKARPAKRASLLMELKLVVRLKFIKTRPLLRGKTCGWS